MAETQALRAQQAPKETVLWVQRGSDAESAQWIEYRVPTEEGMLVLDALHWVQAHLAPDLNLNWLRTPRTPTA